MNSDSPPEGEGVEYFRYKGVAMGEVLYLLTNEPNDEGCDATDDAIYSIAGNINFYLLILDRCRLLRTYLSRLRRDH
jgi:hypothetical protein